MNQPVSTHNDPRQPQQEVDLLGIIVLFSRWLRSLCRGAWGAVTGSLIYLIRKSPQLALFVVVGTAAAWGFGRLEPKFFTSSTIVRSNSMASHMVVGNLKTLDYLLDAGRYAELTSLLDLSEAEAAQVKSLSGRYGVVLGSGSSSANLLPAYYVRHYNPRDTALRISPYYLMVVAQVYSEEVYPALSRALVGYIGSSSFDRQANALREGQVRELIANTDKEIAALQQALEVVNAGGRQVAFPAMPGEKQKSELVQMREALTALYERKSELERQNALFTAPATVVADFSKSFRPSNRNRFYLLAGAVLSFALGLIALQLWDNRKRIVAAVRENR